MSKLSLIVLTALSAYIPISFADSNRTTEQQKIIIKNI